MNEKTYEFELQAVLPNRVVYSIERKGNEKATEEQIFGAVKELLPMGTDAFTFISTAVSSLDNPKRKFTKQIIRLTAEAARNTYIRAILN